MDNVRETKGSLLGLWSRDFVLATGEYASSDNYGIVTSLPENPDRNLYKMARDEFEDISYKALAMLCETHEPVCYELAEKTSLPRYKRLIFHLGNVIYTVGCLPLETALFEVLGSNWKQEYELLSDKYAQQ